MCRCLLGDPSGADERLLVLSVHKWLLQLCAYR